VQNDFLCELAKYLFFLSQGIVPHSNFHEKAHKEKARIEIKFLKVLCNENRGGSELVSIDPFL
jgi:hypothetical protein